MMNASAITTIMVVASLQKLYNNADATTTQAIKSCYSNLLQKENNSKKI